MWADSLSCQEAEFTQQAIDALGSALWARPLLSHLKQKGGLSSINMPLLFEVRVAYALHILGMTASYEHKTGVGDKSVDFRVHNGSEWLIEAVRLGESAAVKAATKESGNLFSLHLSSSAMDKKQSEEGELLKSMERISDKACKFPQPCSTAFQVILADVRGYLGRGGDHDDYREMAYGTGAAPPERTHWWGDQPILGLFDPKNTRDGAQLVQQRIHFIGFIREGQFCDGEIQKTGFFLWNPNLFSDQAAAERAFATYPLRPPIAKQPSLPIFKQ